MSAGHVPKIGGKRSSQLGASDKQPKRFDQLKKQNSITKYGGLPSGKSQEEKEKKVNRYMQEIIKRNFIDMVNKYERHIAQ